MSREIQEALRALKKAVQHHQMTNRSGVALECCPKVGAAKECARSAGLDEQAVQQAVASALRDCVC